MSGSPTGQRQSGAPRSFPALSYRNYRLWFYGQMVSLFGTWMQNTAQGYLVYELTHSAAFLGYAGLAAGVATGAFTLWGGVAADRVPRRSLLVATQTAAMLLAFALAAMTFARVVRPWHVVAFAFALGVVNAFDAPARQSFVLELVDRRHLANAIAMNAMMFNMATALGPAFAGAVYAALGPGWCFTINGLTFLAIIGALLAMRFERQGPAPASGSPLASLGEGLRAVRADRQVIALIALVAAVNLFGMSVATLTPAWAVRVLRGDARTNGLLQSVRGLGALAAAFGMASLARLDFRGRLLTAGSLAFPLMLLLFSFTRHLGPSLAVLLGVGAANILVNNLCNSLVQTLIPDAVRGRVMGLYVLAFFGAMSLGSLLAGTLAEWLGESAAIAVTALATLACSVAVAVAVPTLRRLP